ncbi:MAG TPA: pilus assembly protein TadG-related protein, partial [Isosphaeraceae bacterium]|nr:pilus assembly protein TadG-related protein [Isosphaeraceae bacterium]
MVRRDPSRHSGPKRTGKTLVLFALLLPLLLGMVGLAIDGGLLLAAYRQTQNAADTAALSAAYDLLNNLSAASAQTNGANYVQTNNNMAKATVTINVPPSSGPHAGSASFAEALISYPYQTSFIQLLGVNTNQTVGARAVAGFEGSTTGAGITTLQQSTTSGGGTAGITVSGGATLTINGPIVDNATTSSAFSTSGGTVSATSTSVAATTGVNYFDPLANLPVPSTATGVVNTAYGAFTASGPGTQTLSPGIYTSINISNGATVIFSPGTYVITGGGLNIDNTSTVSGNGVLFYNTGKSYSAVPSETNPIPIVGLDSTTSGGGLRALPNDRGTTNQYGSI